MSFFENNQSNLIVVNAVRVVIECCIFQRISFQIISIIAFGKII